MIRLVKQATLKRVIGERKPVGMFLTRDVGVWVAMDNSTGDAWTEDFKHLLTAIRWLRNKVEISDLHDSCST